MHFEIYQEKPGLLSDGLGRTDYRWRLRADNGRIIAVSGEGYQNKSDCQHGIALVQGTSTQTPTVDKTAPTGLLSSVMLAAALGIKA